MALFDFLSGAIAFGFFTLALFFLRFWRRTRDALFAAFAAAFALLGLAQAVQALADIPQEDSIYVFLIRLAAFSLIIVAVVRKNHTAS